MAKTNDPILISIRRARARPVTDIGTREQKPPAPAPIPEPETRIDLPPNVQLAPPPASKEPEEPATPTPDPILRALKTTESIDLPPAPDSNIRADNSDQPGPLDWLFRR